MAASQKYEIIGAHNVRDLGGYKTRDGKVYKIGEFICGDSLNRIHKSGIKSLIEKNLTTVIDLRTKKVLEEKPNLLVERPRCQFLKLSTIRGLVSKISRNLYHFCQGTRWGDWLWEL